MANATVTLRITGESGQLVGELRVAKSALTGVATESKKAGDTGAISLRKITKEAGGMQNAMASLKRQVLGFAATLASIQTVRSLVTTADAMTSLNARLRIVTSSTEAFAQAQQDVRSISAATRSDLESTATLYTRLTQASEQLGLKQSEVAEITRAVGAAVTLSGTSAQAAAAGVTQLAQAFGSGVLSGDEFRSVMENSPRVVKALTDSLGISIGQLRALANEQKLTADIVAESLRLQLDTLRSEMEQTPVTVGQALGQIQNAWALYIDTVNTASGETNALAGVLAGVVEIIQAEEEAARNGAGGMEVLATAMKLVVGGAVLIKNAVEAVVSVFAAALDAAIAFQQGIYGVFGAAIKVAQGYRSALLSLDFEGAWGALTQGQTEAAGAISGAATRMASAVESAKSGVNSAITDVADTFERLNRVVRNSAESTSASAKVDEELEKRKKALRERVAELVGALGSNAEASKKAAKEAEALLAAHVKLHELVGKAAERIAGPVERAWADYAEQIRNLAAAAADAIKKGDDLVEVQDALRRGLEALTRAHEDNLRAIEAENAANQRAADISGNLIAALDEEIRLSRLSSQERRVEEILSRAVADAQEEANRQQDQSIALDAAEQASLRGVIAQRLEEIDVIDQQREAAERWARAWDDAATDVADALANVIVDGLDDWDDFGDALVDIAKRMVADILSEFLKLQVIQPIFNGLASGFSGNGFNFSGLLGGQGGGFNLASLGSAFGFGGGAASTLPAFLQGGGIGYTGAAVPQIAGTTAGLGSVTGGSNAAASTPGGFGNLSGLLSNPVTWIVAGMMVNQSLFNQGWRVGGGSTTLPNGAEVSGGGDISALGRFVTAGPLGPEGIDRILQGIGFSSSIASLISGSALHTRLFGRKAPVLTNGETTFGVGPGGVFGSERYRTLEEGGVFRSDRRRWHEFGLSPESQEYGEGLFEFVNGVMSDAAARLQREAPENFEAALRVVSEYNKDGTIKASQMFVDIFGRAFEVASEEEALQRLAAEATIAAIDGFMSQVSSGVNDAIQDYGASGGADGLNEMVLRDLKSAEQTQGEAHLIAERWRHDTTLLAEGAAFLLDAASDINAGFALLGEGSTLTQITDLTEELQQAGEPLLATYQRMVVSTKLLDDALSLSGVQLDLTREEFVRFATDIADAAGGIERAQSLWSSYFQNFYSDSERAALALDRGRATASSEFADIGLDLNDFTGEGGAAAFRTLFEEALPTLSAEAVVEWLEAADALGIVIDLQAQYSAALGAAAKTLDDLMTGIEARIADLEPEPVLSFDERAAAIQADTDLLLTRAQELGASEEDLQRIRYLGQLQMDQLNDERYAAFERQAALLQAYRAEVQSIADLIDERNFSEFQIELRDIYRWGAEATDSLNAAARAAGMEVAAARDLALVHEEVAFRVAAAIARLRERGRDLVAQLQGTPLSNIEEQIATLESAQQSYVNSALGGIEQITQASDNAYTAQVNAQQRIREFLDNLLIGPLGGLRPRDALVEAQAQFDALLERALGGDVEAQAALPALAQQLLQLGQQVYASGDPYFALRDSIIEALEQVAALPVPEPTITPDPVGTGGGGGGGTVDIGVSPELQALYAERDRLLAEQTAAQQLALAQEVAGIIRDLVAATGDPLLEIAASLGLNLNQLVAQLGVNLDDLTVTTAIQLADVAQAMGVNLSELSAAVGVDLGNLADAQSLLNDALEAEINSLPQAERDLLAPLLADIEAAAALGDKAGTEAALAELIGQINTLAPGIRDQLAPFFDGVDPATYNELSALTNIDDYTQVAKDQLLLQTPLLERIADNLRASNQELGFPSYQVGTGYVPRTGLAMLHQAEMVIPAPVADFFRREGLPLPSRELQSEVVADEIRALRRERREADAEINRRLQAVENATTRGAGQQAEAIDKQTEKLARAAR